MSRRTSGAEETFGTYGRAPPGDDADLDDDYRTFPDLAGNASAYDDSQEQPGSGSGSGRHASSSRSQGWKGFGKGWDVPKIDPAPEWDGQHPETHFRTYWRNLKLWLIEAELRLPPAMIGKRIMDRMPIGSRLASLLSHLTVEEITKDTGYKTILGIIEEAHDYLKEQRLEDAFDEALFRGRRDRGQLLTTYLNNKRIAFSELSRLGMDFFKDEAGRHLIGHLVLKHGHFTEDQKQRLKVVTNGSIDIKVLEPAIRKIFGDRLVEEAPPGHGRRHYFEEDQEGDGDDQEQYALGAEVPDDYLDDLVAYDDVQGEMQMVFPEELPEVLDEMDALDLVHDHLGSTFYEMNRNKGKGKGKGKGAGKYQWHRKALQQSRTSRGFDKPWLRDGRDGRDQQPFRTKMSLADIQKKTRCHNCKQVGHWSRDCPLRKKPTSPTSTSSVGSPPSRTSMSGFSAGFFVTPPAEESSDGTVFHVTQEPEASSNYMVALCPPSSDVRVNFLSYVFLAHESMDGLALVDTAAQHGLCGQDTLDKHNSLLKRKFGLQVQWSNESGGAVRGVCGKEQQTRVAYVPIGLAGCCGLLKVQVVPGEVPFLLPAHMLTELKAVIDMQQFVIVYNDLCVYQSMVRMNTGHVAVNITEFAKSGFRLPAGVSGSSPTQVWKGKPQANLAEYSVGVFHAERRICALSPSVASLGLAIAVLCCQRAVEGLVAMHVASTRSTSTPPRSSTSTAGGPSQRASLARAGNPSGEAKLEHRRPGRGRSPDFGGSRASTSRAGGRKGLDPEAHPGDHGDVPARAPDLRREQDLGLHDVPRLRRDDLHAQAPQGGPSHVERGARVPGQGLQRTNLRQEEEGSRHNGSSSSTITVDPNAEIGDFEDLTYSEQAGAGTTGTHDDGEWHGLSSGVPDPGGDLRGPGRSASRERGLARRGDDREPVLLHLQDNVPGPHGRPDQPRSEGLEVLSVQAVA